MRTHLLLWLLLAFPLNAAETPRTFPLWDGRETVEAYVAKVNLPPTKSVDLGGGVMLDLVLIPAGQFIMGTPEPQKPRVSVEIATYWAIFGGTFLLAFSSMLVVRLLQKKKVSFSLRYLLLITALCGLLVGGLARRSLAFQELNRYETAMKAYREFATYPEKPAHSVTLTRPFYMGKYTITQAQYEALMGTNPSIFKNVQGPVENVSWNDAAEYLKKLNTLLHDPAFNAILPTEAQWEYACRAGTQTRFNSGDRDSDLDAAGWFKNNSGGKTHPVGGKKANAFGLYDMHGNVKQWCQDWFGVYFATPAIDPKGPANGVGRVLRGGSSFDFAWHCRSTCRSIIYPPDTRQLPFSFRIVINLNE